MISSHVGGVTSMAKNVPVANSLPFFPAFSVLDFLGRIQLTTVYFFSFSELCYYWTSLQGWTKPFCQSCFFRHMFFSLRA